MNSIKQSQNELQDWINLGKKERSKAFLGLFSRRRSNSKPDPETNLKSNGNGISFA